MITVMRKQITVIEITKVYHWYHTKITIIERLLMTFSADSLDTDVNDCYILLTTINFRIF